VVLCKSQAEAEAALELLRDQLPDATAISALLEVYLPRFLSMQLQP
jgi:hypothetical protein